MSLLSAVSTSRFLRLVDPSIRSDDPHIFVRQSAVTRPPCPYNHLTGYVAIIPVGFSFSRRRRFTSALGTYPENPTRLISHTHKSSGTSPSCSLQQYLSTPILNPNNAVLMGRNPSPSFWLSSKRFSLRLGPIDYVCDPIVVRLRRITDGNSQTCTILSLFLRWYSKTSILHRDPWLDPSPFIEWTTHFSTLCHADLP